MTDQMTDNQPMIETLKRFVSDGRASYFWLGDAENHKFLLEGTIHQESLPHVSELHEQNYWNMCWSMPEPSKNQWSPTYFYL